MMMVLVRLWLSVKAKKDKIDNSDVVGATKYLLIEKESNFNNF